MALTILTATTRYLDFGAVYLTEDQMKAAFLELRVSIISMQSPLSESFRRNPPQSVYGYLTTCYQECVYEEIECRYDYQSLYRDLDSYRLLAQLDCIYYDAIATNQNSIAGSNTAQGPYTILQVDGLTNVLRRPVDSFRFKGLNPCVFDFILYWSVDSTDYGNCGVEVFDLPAPLPPSNDAPGYNPSRNSDPNSAEPIILPTPPTDEDKTNVPEDAPVTDFSERNNPEPPPPVVLGNWTCQIQLTFVPGGGDTVNLSPQADSLPVPVVQVVADRWKLLFNQNGIPDNRDLGPTSLVSNAVLVSAVFTPL